MRIIGEADIAVTNGGGLRDDIRIGDITKGDINAILPFGNVLVIKEVTPKDIKEILEIGLSSLPATHGRFPHVSGMSVLYDPAKDVGERVISVTIDGNAINLDDDSTTYRLATNNFMAAGGDGYEILSGLATLAELDSLDDMLIRYITENLGGRITADNAKIEGRLAAQ
jgi:2',3'-cyclic-nucleotide 2'-phosphodiesterase (5'-nucleotidase family)